jgi:hypothetical protein
MTVLSLHELCRQELRTLLDTRYMRGGWNRAGDRKAALRFNEVHTLMEAQLKELPDRLLVRPERDKLLRHLSLAAAERTLQAMVERFVRELSTLPVPDQAEAYAVTELRERMIYLDQVRSALTEARTRIAQKVGKTGVRGVDFDELLGQLDAAVDQTGREYAQVESNLAAYESAF